MPFTLIQGEKNTSKSETKTWQDEGGDKGLSRGRRGNVPVTTGPGGGEGSPCRHRSRGLGQTSALNTCLPVSASGAKAQVSTCGDGFASSE